MPRQRRVKPVPTVAELRASALKYAKIAFYLNGTFFVFYLALMVYSGWEVIHLSPWHWINVVVDLFLLVWFGFQARKTLRKYVELKEEYERG